MQVRGTLQGRYGDAGRTLRGRRRDAEGVGSWISGEDTGFLKGGGPGNC